MSDADASPLPLAGLRVVELARVLAGPWAGQILADLGAEVIKIERPGAGDDTRSWGPPFMRTAENEDLGACFYHSCNRGKSSVAIDLSTPQGQRKVRDLVIDADILIENYKVGDLARYGLDWESLRNLNPQLIYCSITGFGQTGPYSRRPGYDFIAQGMGGVMSLTGEPDGPPQKGGVAYADILTGVYSAVAILAAVRQRMNTGQGAQVDMALLDTIVGVLGSHALNFMLNGQVSKRFGNGHISLVPYQSFAAADGDLIVAVGNDAQFARLCAILGREDLATDVRYATNPARVTHRAQIIAILSGLIVEWPVARLAAALEAGGVPAGPINTIDQVFADPQVVARGMEITSFDGDQPLPGVATPIMIDGWRAASDKAAPRLGAGGEVAWKTRRDAGRRA